MDWKSSLEVCEYTQRFSNLLGPNGYRLQTLKAGRKRRERERERSSIGAGLAPMTSRRQIQDGDPHDFRSKMAAPTTSDPRWRPPRHQDGGPHDVRSKMAAPTA